MKYKIIFSFVLILALSLPNFAVAGRIYTWTDENGVTHISSQPPPAGVEHDKTEYKKNPKSNHRSATRNANYFRRIERQADAHRKNMGSLDQKKRDLAKKQAQLERERQQLKFERTKEKYNLLTGNEEKIRRQYHEADNKFDRDKYYNQLKEVDEIKTEYFRLKSKNR